MTTRTITTAQRQWAETWIAGLRDGTQASLGGFPQKLLGSGIISSDEAAALVELDTAPSVSANIIADVLEDALFKSMTVMEACTAREIELPGGDR